MGGRPLLHRRNDQDLYLGALLTISIWALQQRWSKFLNFTVPLPCNLWLNGWSSSVAARSLSPVDLFDFMATAAPSSDHAVRRLQAVANVLDSAFTIPGTKQRVGIDAVIGLIPGIGDIATTILSSYIIWEARNLGVSRFGLARMLANLGIHAAVGSVPLIGDLFDAFFRVNQRNMRILRSHLERRSLPAELRAISPFS